MKVKEVMIGTPYHIPLDANLGMATELMWKGNCGFLPVVDAEKKVCGVITDRDLVVRAIAVGADLASTPVGECATGDPVVAHPDWNLDQAMEAMARAQIGRLPVIDDDNTLAGIVTLGSLALRSKKTKETLEAAKAVSSRSVKATPHQPSSSRPKANAARRTKEAS